MAFGKQPARSRPEAVSSETIYFTERTSAGGGELPVGAVYYVGVDPKSGDLLALYQKADSSNIVLQRRCRFTGAKIAELEMRAASGAAFGKPSDAEAEPSIWTGHGWQVRLSSNGVPYLSRQPQGAL
jgi:hypothetical protein